MPTRAPPPRMTPGASCTWSSTTTSCSTMTPVLTTQCAPIRAPVCTTAPARITVPSPIVALGETHAAACTTVPQPLNRGVSRSTASTRRARVARAPKPSSRGGLRVPGNRLLAAQALNSEPAPSLLAGLGVDKTEERVRSGRSDGVDDHPGVLAAANHDERPARAAGDHRCLTARTTSMTRPWSPAGEAARAGQADSPGEEVLGHCAAEALGGGIERLQVHRLPDRARLDVGSVERRDHVVPSRAERVRRR